MKITPEMMAEDEQRWHTRDVITELSYCGNHMRDRKDMTNLDIRFYAYLMRKAHDMLKAQEPRVMTWDEVLEFAEFSDAGYSEKTPCYIEYFEPEPCFIKWGDAETIYKWVNVYITRNERRRLYNCNNRHGWRLWTSRPSEQQIRDTKWEEMT